ncbi:hypothetical protein CDD83_7531 [Cordyceps sp. RAO-2017]|nr:hypothetical protein CDD83_7531 [Cordyceps sp. RAO-2017]
MHQDSTSSESSQNRSNTQGSMSSELARNRSNKRQDSTTMADPNLIACLYPADTNSRLGRALETVQMDENSSRYVPPQVIRNDSSCSRESSQSLEEEEEGNDETPHYIYSEGLELRFDHPRRNRLGILLGKSSNCDIVLPKLESLKSASQYQCVITFDNQDGTTVTYNDKGGFKRRGFTWILGGDKFFQETRKIFITFHNKLKFQIVVAPHDIHSDLHKEKVAQFRRAVEASVDDLPVSGLGFQSLESTAAASGAETPRRDAILLDNGELDRGAQAVVTRVWDVSTGLEYASKKPLQMKYWHRLKKEGNLLQQIRHDNVVRCIGLMEEPEPQLVLEYAPLGSLRMQAMEKPLSAEENLQLLLQGLSALKYLHGRQDPIAHRDIKPDNILVQSRTPLHVKLSDFGFSKENQDDLKTGIQRGC